jgi:arabinofuranosyltransferase
LVVTLDRRDRAGPGAAGSVAGLCLLGSAMLLTRHDLAPLLLPPLAWAALGRARAVGTLRATGEALAGLAPFLVWTLFALVYYGSATPNTALAKLATGVSAWELALQGGRYFALTAAWDPLGAALIVLGAVTAIRGGPLLRSLGAGIALHLAYVVAIGGDFMVGRFLAPDIAAALALAVARTPGRWLQGGLLPAAALLLLVSPRSALRTGDDYRPVWSLGAPGTAGIVDEKGNEPGSDWLRDAPRDGWLQPGLDALGPPRLQRVLGRPGYRAPLGQILIDPFALSDPFLARLPAEPPWQIGHFQRRVPAGLLAGLADGTCPLADPALAALCVDVRTVVSGPLFTAERWNAWRRLPRRQREARQSVEVSRCPQLLLTAPDSASAGLRFPVAELHRQGDRLRLDATLPVGEKFDRWRLAIVGEPRPRHAELRCLPGRDQAPVVGRLELRYGSEAEAALAARTGPGLVLLPVVSD